MISPHKYLDLDVSILSIGGLIISTLKIEGALKYDELLDKVLIIKGDRAKESFIPTISFLYLLGKIDYQKDIDIIEYIK
jgi:hypothetical protein